MKSKWCSPIKARNGFALAALYGWIVFTLGLELRARADGIPEPGLVMYGVVRNASSANARLISGAINWTITPASGSTIHLTTPLTNIGNQYSYLLRVPFESSVGGEVSFNVLQLNAVSTSYLRTNVTVTLGDRTYSAAIVPPFTSTFRFGPSDRGKTEQVDLAISAPSADSYGIGIPDAWQIEHFGFAGIDPGGDPDGDGTTNLTEYVAGTDPNDFNSVFEFSGVRLVTAEVTELKWAGAENRSYAVLRSSGLPPNGTGFSVIVENLSGTPPFNTLLVTNIPSAGPYFYRLRATLP
jgi:hypothetical protein